MISSSEKTTEQNYEEKYFITGQELALNIIIKNVKYHLGTQ